MTAKVALSWTCLLAFLVCVNLSVPVLSEENLVEEWVIQTASHQEGFYHHPDVSPDDRFTAFSVGASGFDFNTIWIHETETEQLTQVLPTMPVRNVIAGTLGRMQPRYR